MGENKKPSEQKTAVAQLKELVEPHQDLKREQELLKERREKYAEKLKSNKAVREKLSQLNQSFMKIAINSNPQAKGYDLERLMYDIFELGEFNP